MPVSLPNVSLACFGLSYLLAFALELARVRWPRPSLRIAGMILGAAGLFAHTLFLIIRQPTPASAYGALLAVAWVLAIFYLYGSLHHAKQAWAVFVLPVILGLVVMAFASFSTEENHDHSLDFGTRVWGAIHGLFVLSAAVGVSVGAVASTMYLIQARRLRMKLLPLGKMKMLSLERLEGMNRRAVNLAFPLLTVGLLLGAVLLRHYHDFADNWLSVKFLGTVGLWVVFLVLTYLRYAVTLPGRRLAMLTIAAFVLMLLVLIAGHPFVRGDSA